MLRQARSSGAKRSLLHGEYFGLVRDLIDLERFRLPTCHPGRAVRHTRQRDPLEIGPLGEELADGACRDVSFDHVAVYEGDMTAPQLVGNAVLPPNQRHVVAGRHVHFEALAPQVRGMALAAAALRIHIHVDGCRFCTCGASKDQRRSKEDPSTKHSPLLFHTTRITPIMPLSWCSRMWQ